MGITEQFTGLDMGKLIGAPLTAATDASLMLANSTAEFINQVGFDENGKVRNAAFVYQVRNINEDGTSSLDDMRVEVPMLAVVPIPGLQLDEMKVFFDMEVKQSERIDSTSEIGAGISGGLGLGRTKVCVNGSVSSHKDNTRSSDYSAKYHVDIRATNHGMPEGLARVLDMMAANTAPVLIGTTLKNADGSELLETEHIQAQKRQKLRDEIAHMETQKAAAWDYLQDCITQFREEAKVQQNIYRVAIARFVEASNETETYIANAYEQVAASWNTFQDQVQNIIRIIVDNKEEKFDGVSDLFRLLAFREGSAQNYDEKESQYHALALAQENAVMAQRQFITVSRQLFKKKTEYRKMLCVVENDFVKHETIKRDLEEPEIEQI